jgi:hypothetical protein
VYRLTSLHKHRYIGDIGTMVVHDRWHPDCESCLPELLVSERVAVGFEPDELNQALNEGFECCSWCFDRTVPPQPADWLDPASEGETPETGG